MFRFTIRDVLWLTALVALGVAWRVDRERVKSQGEHGRQVVDRFTKVGIDPDILLRDLEAPRPPLVRVGKVKPGTAPFRGSNNYQSPPRPPKRVSDEERP